jgi:flagellar biosynthesis/type III secretory pathway ATPase
MATTRDSEDLVSVGAYIPGSNPRIDEALSRRTPVEDFLRQPADDLCSYAESVDALHAL